MKKIYFKIFLLLSTSIVGYSQVDYNDYHGRINRAEELITKEQFDQSINIYESVFAEYEYVFVKDLVIAAQIAILNNDVTKATTLIERAMKNGYDCSCIEKIPVFKKYIKSKDWQLLIERKKEYEIEYKKSIDLKLNYEFHKRYKSEQEAKGTNRYSSMVVENYQRIKSLMDSIPFPSEKRIGLDNGTILRTSRGGKLNSCNVSNSKVIPTLLHYDNPITDIGLDKFTKAIKSGDLHPRQFAYIYSFETNYVSRLSKNKDVNSPHLPQYAFNYAFGKKTDDIDKSNKDRIKFGINTIEIDKVKSEVEKKFGLRLNF